MQCFSVISGRHVLKLHLDLGLAWRGSCVCVCSVCVGGGGELPLPPCLSISKMRMLICTLLYHWLLWCCNCSDTYYCASCHWHLTTNLKLSPSSSILHTSHIHIAQARIHVPDACTSRLHYREPDHSYKITLSDTAAKHSHVTLLQKNGSYMLHYMLLTSYMFYRIAVLFIKEIFHHFKLTRFLSGKFFFVMQAV